MDFEKCWYKFEEEWVDKNFSSKKGQKIKYVLVFISINNAQYIYFILRIIIL